jgi:hypothetical protein
MSTNDEYSNKILAIRKLAGPYGVKVKESSRDHLLLVLEDGADRITDIPGGVEAIAGLQRKTRRQNPTPGVKK